MSHRSEIDSIVAQVTRWPAEERAALAFQILSEIRRQARKSVPRGTLSRARGIAAGTSTPPDDATVRSWLQEHRVEKYG